MNLLALVLIAVSGVSAFASAPKEGSSNHGVTDFRRAKKLAPMIHRGHMETIYCRCKVKSDGKSIDLASCGYTPLKDAKRAQRMEWEHVVPAEAFGQSFKEWREGAPQCFKRGKKFKGRKCAETNPDFDRMEGDLYNLWPEVGELNGLRSNYSMAELGAEKAAAAGKPGMFGGCKAMVEDRKFEPMPFAKGIVARTYMYMDQAYPGRGVISDKNKNLFEAWSKLHPVSEWECERAKRIAGVQGNINPVLEPLCKAIQ